jgi:hypothetical protein
MFALCGLLFTDWQALLGFSLTVTLLVQSALNPQDLYIWEDVVNGCRSTDWKRRPNAVELVDNLEFIDGGNQFAPPIAVFLCSWL